MALVYCVDFGSTFTKAALVDTSDGSLLGTGSHRTTIDTDVLDGWDTLRAGLEPFANGLEVPVLACSSAGGGLRIAVVGNEELVTAEAGRRVALSRGGRVVQVSSYDVDLAALRASRPDVVLLVGGTDGGNAEVLLANVDAIARARWSGPVVVAGNAEAVPEISARLSDRGVPFVVADNVVPEIGVLRPDGARAAIREMFLKHVIGGKHLSQRTDFTSMVQGATPDIVLTAVELLSGGLGPDRPGAGDVVVVDVGGATTDIHSVVRVDPEDAGLSREVVAALPVTRTVEGDLGMRWSAVPTVEAALVAGIAVPAGLPAAAQARRDDPGLVPASRAETRHDLAIASAAVALAVRRHAGRQQVVFSPEGRLVERSGKDLREVRLLVGSGGVLRHASSRRDALSVIAAGHRVTTLRVAGWCRATRASLSTRTTCWPRPACSSPSTRPRPTTCCPACGGGLRRTPSGQWVRAISSGSAPAALFGHRLSCLERQLGDEERDHQGHQDHRNRVEEHVVQRSGKRLQHQPVNGFGQLLDLLDVARHVTAPTGCGSLTAELLGQMRGQPGGLDGAEDGDPERASHRAEECDGARRRAHVPPFDGVLHDRHDDLHAESETRSEEVEHQTRLVVRRVDAHDREQVEGDHHGDGTGDREELVTAGLAHDDARRDGCREDPDDHRQQGQP